MGYEEFSVAMTNRSLRTVKAELEFLADNGTLTSQQLNSILSQLPAESTTTKSSNALTNGISSLSLNNRNRVSSPVNNNNNNTFNEKQDYYNQPSSQQNNPPPPSYNTTTTAQPPPLPAVSTPIPNAPLTHAVALYAYAATDAGDLQLQPNDRIAVTEYMNADWWKGRSERTGAEGIFPRSYVRVEEKSLSSSSGIMPMDVAAGGNGAGAVGGAAGDPGPNKLEQGGKKFGKKLGNAAIFGAGATIGSNLVNSIF